MVVKYLIVGISGTTNSGKTSTVEKLCQYFKGATTICQDLYFLEPGDERLEIIPELNNANWECLDSLDMDSMMQDVHKWTDQQQSKGDNSTSLLLVDGFLIFNYRPLASLFHRKYFLTVDRQTCEERRGGRTYNPPDPPGYFEKCVWPMYLKNFQEIKSQPDICYLDGTQYQTKIVEKIRDDILAEMTC